jgi:SAM-dependent methyltransferase
MTMHDVTQELKRYYDDLAKSGPYATLAPDNRGGPKSRYVAEVFDAALLPLLKRETIPLRLLDFGCGTGIFTIKALPYVKEIVGVDLSLGLLLVARELAAKSGVEIPFMQSDGARLPFRSHAINRVLAREVLCNVPDEALPDVLKEFARILEPKGKVYLLEQVSESPFWQRHPKTPLVRKRSVDELINLFKTGGFGLESAVTVRQPRFPWIYLIWFRILPVFLIPLLAKLEVMWNHRFCPLRTKRWQDALFVFRLVR